MLSKKLPFDKRKIEEIKGKWPTPFHIYDEKAIRKNAHRLYRAFSWVRGFKNHFAVKALPNPFILKILKEEGMGTDCSSLPELVLSEKAGIKGEDIMFTSNDTPVEEFAKAHELGAIINLDDITHIETLEKALGGKVPELISFRYNPGPLRKGNVIIGDPKEAKYGLTREQLFKAYRIMKEKGCKRFALHTMVVSNELNPEYHIETAKMLFELAAEIKERLGIKIEFINLGGGYGIPMKPGEKPIDLGYVSKGIRKQYDKIIRKNGLHPLRIIMESGRAVTGPYGYLVMTVRHVMRKYKDFAGVDATMANLMRPALYGAYHHITVLGKEDKPKNCTYDVVGSLCENNDKFAIDRKIPEIEEGDILVQHDTGAHGHAMGFNYNGKLRSAELLLREDGSVMEIRRAEAADDYFSTLDFGELKKFK
ncbi:diaminopimelate decarboxylase [Candidatus Woesearchaeota archaeon]|nr:diaminopimelate decarboxylase [Candidatus Woesearchaeota archaeon]